jgi:hypothetical protein
LRLPIGELADASGFPKPATGARRAGAPSTWPRYKTGRNQQIHIKATPEVIERLYGLSDEKHVPLGELLEQAPGALETSK